MEIIYEHYEKLIIQDVTKFPDTGIKVNFMDYPCEWCALTFRLSCCVLFF